MMWELEIILLQGAVAPSTPFWSRNRAAEAPILRKWRDQLKNAIAGISTHETLEEYEMCQRGCVVKAESAGWKHPRK